MTVRIPLVINAGQIEQLQAGDSISTGNSPGLLPQTIDGGSTYTIPSNYQAITGTMIKIPNGLLVIQGILIGQN